MSTDNNKKEKDWVANGDSNNPDDNELFKGDFEVKKQEPTSNRVIDAEIGRNLNPKAEIPAISTNDKPTVPKYSIQDALKDGYQARFNETKKEKEFSLKRNRRKSQLHMLGEALRVMGEFYGAIKGHKLRNDYTKEQTKAVKALAEQRNTARKLKIDAAGKAKTDKKDWTITDYGKIEGLEESDLRWLFEQGKATGVDPFNGDILKEMNAEPEEVREMYISIALNELIKLPDFKDLTPEQLKTFIQTQGRIMQEQNPVITMPNDTATQDSSIVKPQGSFFSPVN
jgi:hypothetical protein